MADQCEATTKNNQPCSARPRPGRRFCPWHDPEIAAQRSQWSARGGANRSHRSRARKRLIEGSLTAPEVEALLGKALGDVLEGKIKPGVAIAAATLARAIVVVREAGEIEERLEALERAMERDLNNQRRA